MKHANDNSTTVGIGGRGNRWNLITIRMGKH